MELKDLALYNGITDANLRQQIDRVYELTKDTINGIAGCHKNYTMHNVDHGLRVAQYMSKIAFGIDGAAEKMLLFSQLERTLMLLSALLHDIGMFFTDADKDAIMRNEIKYTDSIQYEGVRKSVGSDLEAVQEIIRATHAQRIREFLAPDEARDPDIAAVLQINGYSYADELIKICEAHGEAFSFLSKLSDKKTIGDYACNIRFIAALLRIADYLDLDTSRTPMLWYRLNQPVGFSDGEWQKHFMISNTEKLTYAYDKKLMIFFNGKSDNPSIHRKYLKYTDDLRAEIDCACALLNRADTPPHYLLNLSTHIDDSVETLGFTYSDLRLSLNYREITRLLMGENIYGDNRLGLRELMQNAIDACKLMREIAAEDGSFGAYRPTIRIEYSQKKNVVSVVDNGIGMSLDIVKQYFLNVGSSYYTSKPFLFKNYAYKPIGRFGIGFLACYLLSDKVKVTTRRYDDSEVNIIELEKESEYVVTKKAGIPTQFGTRIDLDYAQFFRLFKTEENLTAFLEYYFYTDVDITLYDRDTKKECGIRNKLCNEILTADSMYRHVDCSAFSKNLSGHILMRYKGMNLRPLDFKNAYFVHEDTLVPLEDMPKNLRQGNLRKTTYPALTNPQMEHYRKIGFKNDDAVGTVYKTAYKNKQILYLYSLLSANTVPLENALKNSNFPYIEDFLWYRKQELVFLKEDQELRLFQNRFGANRFRNEETGSQSLLYNQNILVAENSVVTAPHPFDIDIFKAVVDVNGFKVDLDVSRRRIIKSADGNRIAKELAYILTKANLENVTEKSDRVMVQAYLDYHADAFQIE